MRIRNAKIEDAAEIAKVHVDSWRSTYKGMISERVLQSLSYQERENLWKQVLNREKSCVDVAENETSDIVGFASWGRERTGKYSTFQGELYAIYLLAEVQGIGLGKQLIYKVAQSLKKQGLSSMLVWVLADNQKARGFYEAFGPERVDTEPIEIGGDAFEEIAYGWPTLKVFE